MQLSSWSLSFFSLLRLMGYYMLVIISWTTSSTSSSRSLVLFACVFVFCSCAYLSHALLFYVLCLVFHLLRCYYVMSDVFVLSHVLLLCRSVSSQRVMLRCVWLPYMASCLSRCLIWKLPYLAVACCFACILMMRTHCLTWRMYCLPILGIMCLVA